jgi:hypothetical protein
LLLSLEHPCKIVNKAEVPTVAVVIVANLKNDLREI